MFRDNFVIFDGAMGTSLQKYGLAAGELPELLNFSHPEIVEKIHKEYLDAGAQIITANTFGANRLKLGEKATVESVISKAINIARNSGAKYVALDLGPTGQVLEPIGTLSFEEAYDLYKQQVIAGVSAGADLVLIETMSDLLETKAAVLAVKENCNLPLVCTMTFGEDKRTFMGTSPKNAAITLCSLGVDAVGVNCSLGPNELLDVVEEICKFSTKPVIVQPNAGLPKVENGKTIFTVTPNDYKNAIEKMISMGVSIIGGCCGTTPEHIKAVSNLVAGRKPVKRAINYVSAITSGQTEVILTNNTAIIGERINPTGKPKLKEALKNKDYDYIISEAVAQQNAGADVLDVNAGLPDINEGEVLKEIIKKLQAVTPLPLQIDSSDEKAIEQAVRVYSGKPIINSVNGKKESMEKILPLVKKYGAAVVALTLDENGIPETAEGRLKIAQKIVSKAEEYGIPKTDIFVDCLVLTASTNQQMVMETLRAIGLVKQNLGVKTVLGVSNVSFGLPSREILNSAYLAAAFGAGLDMPILNPLSEEYKKVVLAFKVLNNEDINAKKFISEFSCLNEKSVAVQAEMDMKQIIINGLKSKAKEKTLTLLESKTPIEIIDTEFIPALDIVGEKFEKGEMFLPQLMASAEAVKAGFELLKGKNTSTSKGKVVLATVKGDIHDIGKNIVKMLMQNYGYDVIDLGKDVEPLKVVQTVKETGANLVGLSALMTTTVKSMEETVKELKNAGLNCKIMVGGAVLSPEYAKMVGADYYAKDAQEGVKIASEVYNQR
ncbi:MAG: homocysteine S-methyltransferase family protein [Clostridia bacterium]|nr:homocysteine S-methyltransferase family protein [Clostridia bacterium]